MLTLTKIAAIDLAEYCTALDAQLARTCVLAILLEGPLGAAECLVTVAIGVFCNAAVGYALDKSTGVEGACDAISGLVYVFHPLQFYLIAGFLGFSHKFDHS